MKSVKNFLDGVFVFESDLLNSGDFKDSKDSSMASDDFIVSGGAILKAVRFEADFFIDGALLNFCSMPILLLVGFNVTAVLNVGLRSTGDNSLDVDVRSSLNDEISSESL